MKPNPWMVIALAFAGVSWEGQAANEIVGIGYTVPRTPSVTAGQPIALFVPKLNVPDAVASGTPLPTSLSGVTVAVRVGGSVLSTAGYPALLPIFRIQSDDCTNGTKDCPNTQITVQIPTERVCASPPKGSTCSQIEPADLPEYLILNVQANGIKGQDFYVQVYGAAPHLLSACDAIFGLSRVTDTCRGTVAHADGSLVDASNPAVAGETIALYAVGLLPVGSGFTSGTATPVQVPVLSRNAPLRFSYQIAATAATMTHYVPVAPGVTPSWAGLIPGYVGLYQINAVVPPAPAGTVRCEESSGVNATIELVGARGTVTTCVQP